MEAHVLVLFGSQTGQAQDVAERIGREAATLLFSPRVLPLDAYDVTQLPSEPRVIFVVSTAGQGQFPDNAQSFWKFLLRKSLPPDSLSALRYAVFGLGDSGYPKYNVAAKKLDRRLAALGARSLLPAGLGDDQHPSGYEAALDSWLPGMWSQLRALLPLPPGVQQPVLDASTVLQLGKPKLKVTLLPKPAAPAAGGPAGPRAADSNGEGHSAQGVGQAAELQGLVAVAAAFRRVMAQASGAGAGAAVSAPPPPSAYGPWRPFPAPVLVNRRLTSPGHSQDVRHLELSLRGSGMEAFTPGDLLCVWPRPEAEAVDALLQRLDLDGEQIAEVTLAEPPPSGEAAEVARGPVRAFAEAVLDVAGSCPRRRFFQMLAHFTPEAAELERERLQYFASAEGRDDLYRYNQREGRSVLEVLQDFKSCRPPLAWLLEAGPLLKPRQFSISSSARMHPGAAHLTVAVVEWTTPYKRRRRGLCSTYLASRHPAAAAAAAGGEASSSPAAAHGGSGVAAAAAADVVAVWLEPGSMRMPASPAVPLILVGPGTGIAPFKSFLEERAAMQQCSSSGELAAAACCLFVGCRKLQGDAYYLELWSSYREAGVLSQQPHGLTVAASQDQAEKVYVTHRIREHGAALWDLIASQGACVYVSGSAQKMPADVAAAFEDVAVQHGGLSREQAGQYFRRMEVNSMGLKINYEAFSWSWTDDDGDEEATEDDAQAARSFMMIMVAIFCAVVVLELVVVLALVRLTRPKGDGTTARTLVVLGSGGHTAEMLKLVESLDKQRYTPRLYVVANTDAMSGRKAEDLEKSLLPKLEPSAAGKPSAQVAPGGQAPQPEEPEAAPPSTWEIYEIPRSREVGQWYITSVWTTLYAISMAVVLVFKARPEVVLVNGPGTCIPVCFAAVMYRLLLGAPCKIIYVESIARTQKLSLSGKILYQLRVADLLLVQWQELADKLPRAKFAGRLY